MKKTIFNFALITITAGTILTSCASKTEKVQDAKEKVQDAKQDLSAANTEANAEAKKAADAKEWDVYVYNTQVRIKDNDARIAELRVRITKPGKVLDPLYAKQIAQLEKRNRDLEARMVNYNKKENDGEAFKREYNHDMDELGHALKDFTVDNKN